MESFNNPVNEGSLKQEVALSCGLNTHCSNGVLTQLVSSTRCSVIRTQIHTQFYAQWRSLSLQRCSCGPFSNFKTVSNNFQDVKTVASDKDAGLLLMTSDREREFKSCSNPPLFSAMPRSMPLCPRLYK